MKNQRKKEKRGKFYAFDMEKFRKMGLTLKSNTQISQLGHLASNTAVILIIPFSTTKFYSCNHK